MISLRKRVTVGMVTMVVGAVSSLAGHAGSAAASSVVQCVSPVEAWSFGPALDLSSGSGSWTLTTTDRVCVGLDVTNTIVPTESGPTSTSQSGGYTGIGASCLLATLQDGDSTDFGVLIGGSVAVIESPSSPTGVFVHVMAPVGTDPLGVTVPCLSGSRGQATGVGEATVS